MSGRFYRALQVLLLGLLLSRGWPGIAVYADVPGRATESEAQRPGTPSDAGRDETGGGQEDEDDWEDWDEWGEQEIVPVLEASPASAMFWEVECATPEQLLELFEAGGRDILLTGDIWLEPGQNMILSAEKARRVDMNGYGIVVPQGALLAVQGPVLFEGNADYRALFQVSGSLELAKGAKIRAEGEGVVGILFSDLENPGRAFRQNDAEITVSGRESAGVEWRDTDEMGVEFICITARGEDSVGVRADGDVRLKMCRVRADGISVDGAGEICADTAELNPPPDQVKEIRRGVMANVRIVENGVSVGAGASHSELAGKLRFSAYYWFYDLEGKQQSIAIDTPVSWKNIPVDLDTPGTYEVVCQPDGAPGWLPLKLPQFRVPVHVVEKGHPHIQEIFRMEHTAAFRYMGEITGAERIVLLCSEDGGETWTDASKLPGCTADISPWNAGLNGLEENRRYLFKLSVVGGPMEGESEAVAFSYFETDADNSSHGNRDEDDREDQGELPPDNSGNGTVDGSGQNPGGGDHDSGGDGNQNPDGGGQGPDGDGSQNSGGSGGQGPDGSGSQSPDGSGSQSPDGSGSQSPDGNGSQSPDGNGSQSPDGNGSQSPDGSGSQSPDGSGSQSPDDSGTQIPTTTGTYNPAIPAAAPADQSAGGNIILSKSMLDDQLKANPKTVTFLGEGIRAVVPSERLRELKLAEGETFSALLKRTSADSFVVRFWAGGRETAEFGEDGFIVDIDWDGAKEGRISVRGGADDSAVSATVTDSGLRVPLRTTGTYCIQVENNLPEMVGSGSLTRAFMAAITVFFALY